MKKILFVFLSAVLSGALYQACDRSTSEATPVGRDVRVSTLGGSPALIPELSRQTASRKLAEPDVPEAHRVRVVLK